MKKFFLCVCVLGVIFLCACQADRKVAQYQYNQTNPPTLAPDVTQAPAKEFDGTLFDNEFNCNVIENGYDSYCSVRPDNELEKAVLKTEPSYILLSSSETSQIRDFLNSVINNLYVANYLSYSESDINKDRENLFSKDICSSVETLNSQADILASQTEYKLTLDVPSMTTLNYNFVSKFTDVNGDTIYRVWAQPVLRITPAENNDLFFVKYPQYYKGDNLIDLWLYIRMPQSSSDKMEIVAMTEIMEDRSSVSIYQGVTHRVGVDTSTTILDDCSAEYVKDSTIEKKQFEQIQSMVRTFETTLYSGDSSVLTKDQLEKTLYPLCTSDLQKKLEDNQYFEKYSNEIAGTNAKLTASIFSSLINEEKIQNDPKLLLLQQFVLPDQTVVYLYSETWLGGLYASSDFDVEFGLKKCELDGGQRQYTCYYLLEKVDDLFKIKAFKIAETGEGESSDTGGNG